MRTGSGAASPRRSLFLQKRVRVLATQLERVPRAAVTTDELRAAGKWAELVEIFGAIDRAAASADLSPMDAPTARLAHDLLMMHICLREVPPNRPGALRILTVPGGAACLRCSDAECKGNRLELARDGATTIIIAHHKTEKSRTNIIIKVPKESCTQTLVDAYLARRHLLLTTDTSSLFLNTRGDGFASDSSFAAYLPRLLAELGLGRLSFTTARRRRHAPKRDER